MDRGMPAARRVVLGTLAWAVTSFGMGSAQARPPGLQVGQRAPTFFLPRLNADGGSRMFRLVDHVGPRAKGGGGWVMLSFAASYCEGCERELALFKRRHKAFTEAGMTVAVVVIDTEPEGIEAMRALTVDRLGVPFAVLSDRFAVLARRYGVQAMPFSVLIGPSGRIRWMHTGYDKVAIDRVVAKVHRTTARRAGKL